MGSVPSFSSIAQSAAITMPRTCLLSSVFIVVCLFAPGARAALEETLPTYHWAYAYLDQLRTRGYLQGLNMAHGPFTRGEVARELLAEQKRIADSPMTLRVSWLYRALSDEFVAEMNSLSGEASEFLEVGVLAQEELKDVEGVSEFRGSARPKVGLSVDGKLFAFNSMTFDQNLLDDSTYLGAEWRGASAFTEQAYIRFRTSHATFIVGRDFNRWGCGRSGTLLISEFARTLDFIVADVYGGPFRLIFLSSQLDDIQGSRRYLSAHRLEVDIQHRLYLGITEAVVYGGPGATPQFPYLNPLLLFHGAQLNGPGLLANTLGSIDILWYPALRWKVFAELLIDDIQLDNEEPGDLEPNEIGLIIGLETADLWGMTGLDVWGEYVRITNRTYNTPNKIERHVHRNRPIGYFEGNDLDRVELGASQWIVDGWQATFRFASLRRGEGRVLADWDAPWLLVDNVSDGYDEPFPFTLNGKVERTIRVGGDIMHHRSSALRFRFGFTYTDIQNKNNVRDKTDSFVSVQFGLWYDFERAFEL